MQALLRAVHRVAPEVGRHDRGRPLDACAHVPRSLRYAYVVGRGERVRSDAAARIAVAMRDSEDPAGTMATASDMPLRRLYPIRRLARSAREAIRVLLAEAGHLFVKAGFRDLVERAPPLDRHVGREAALYAPGPHVPPFGIVQILHDRKRLR